MSGARPDICPVVMLSEVPGGRCPDIRLYVILPPSGSLKETQYN